MDDLSLKGGQLVENIRIAQDTYKQRQKGCTCSIAFIKKHRLATCRKVSNRDN